MSTMKDVFTEMQERIYSRLEKMGVPKERIWSFEELLINKMDWSDFVEKMAGYAAGIIYLAETTGYKEERLWNIFQEMLEDGEDSDKEWEDFKKITEEKDW